MLQALDQRIRKQIVSSQFRIAPDLRRLAKQLTDAHLQRAVKVGHPSLVAFDQLDVVEMRVADERVAVEIRIHEKVLVG